MSGWNLLGTMKNVSPKSLLKPYPMVCDIRGGRSLGCERRSEDGLVTESLFCTVLAMKPGGDEDERPFARDILVLFSKAIL